MLKAIQKFNLSAKVTENRQMQVLESQTPFRRMILIFTWHRTQKSSRKPYLD